MGSKLLGSPVLELVANTKPCDVGVDVKIVNSNLPKWVWMRYLIMAHDSIRLI